MLERYKKRWSFIDTYKDKMKEIKTKSLNGTLNMQIEEVMDWLGVDELNMELFFHTNTSSNEKHPLPNGEYIDEENTELAKFFVLCGVVEEKTGQNIMHVKKKIASKEIDMLH